MEADISYVRVGGARSSEEKSALARRRRKDAFQIIEAGKKFFFGREARVGIRVDVAARLYGNRADHSPVVTGCEDF